jgi:hypothetical protein
VTQREAGERITEAAPSREAFAGSSDATIQPPASIDAPATALDPPGGSAPAITPAGHAGEAEAERIDPSPPSDTLAS